MQWDEVRFYHDSGYLSLGSKDPLEIKCYQDGCIHEVKKITRLESEVLVFLIENRDKCVTREMLFNDIWSGKVVSPGALNQVIFNLRVALLDTDTEKKILKTVHKVGYKLLSDHIEVIEHVSEQIDSLESEAVAEVSVVTPFLSSAHEEKAEKEQPTSVLDVLNSNQNIKEGVTYKRFFYIVGVSMVVNTLLLIYLVMTRLV